MIDDKKFQIIVNEIVLDNKKYEHFTFSDLRNIKEISSEVIKRYNTKYFNDLNIEEKNE
jgi:hypothetical protein